MGGYAAKLNAQYETYALCSVFTPTMQFAVMLQQDFVISKPVPYRGESRS